MKKNKRFQNIFSGILIISMVFILWGCGSSGDNDNNNDATTTVTGTVIDQEDLLSQGHELIIMSNSEQMDCPPPSSEDTECSSSGDYVRKVITVTNGEFSVEVEAGDYVIALQDYDLIMILETFTCYPNTPVQLGNIILPGIGYGGGGGGGSDGTSDGSGGGED